jgi:dihydroorotase
MDGTVQDIAVCIEDGIIADVRRIAPDLSSAGEVHRIDRGFILPGAIDSHVHLRDPGSTKKEDFGTGTASAAFGGVTTVLDMPNTVPPVIDQRSLGEKDSIASGKALVDYGLYIAVDSGMGPDKVGSFFLDRSGTRPVAMKAFLGETTGSLSFGRMDGLQALGRVASGSGAPIAVHAEDGDLFMRMPPPERDKGVLSWHAASRPASSEASAIRKALAAIAPNPPALHVLHVSSAEGLEAASGSGCTMEATPHHLLLDVKWGERTLEREALCKVNPPLRTTDDRAALWRAVSDGRVAVLGSDHAPHLPSEKEEAGRSPSGIPGVETMVPLMMEKVRERKLGIERLIELVCITPAKRFNLTAKGSISVGKDADLSVYDPGETRKVRGEDMHTKCGWTPYEGFSASFPTRVYSRGELIVEGDVMTARLGRGRNVARR